MDRRKFITGALASGAVLALPSFAAGQEIVSMPTPEKRPEGLWRLYLNVFATFNEGTVLHIREKDGTLLAVVKELGRVRDARDFGYRVVGEGPYKWFSVTAFEEVSNAPQYTISTAMDWVAGALKEYNFDWNNLRYEVVDRTFFHHDTFAHVQSFDGWNERGQFYKASEIVATSADHVYMVAVHDFDMEPWGALYANINVNQETLDDLGLSLAEYTANLGAFVEHTLPKHYLNWRDSPTIDLQKTLLINAMNIPFQGYE